MASDNRKASNAARSEHPFWRWLTAGISWRYQTLIRRWKGRNSAPRRTQDVNSYFLDGERYDAEKYWTDRHNRHRHSFRGVGDITRSEEENIQDYVAAVNTITDLLGVISCDPRGKHALDIGCGNGFWAGVLREWGVANYTGVDITDALFDLLRKYFPGFEFVAGKFTQLPLSTEFGLITMIDVTQHITDDSELAGMLQRVQSLLADNGVFIVTFWDQKRPQENFYESFRLFSFYTTALRGMAHTQPLRFRDKFVAAFYSPERCPDPLPPTHLPPEAIARIAREVVAT